MGLDVRSQLAKIKKAKIALPALCHLGPILRGIARENRAKPQLAKRYRESVLIGTFQWPT
jgi:hypothetical protein